MCKWVLFLKDHQVAERMEKGVSANIIKNLINKKSSAPYTFKPQLSK